MILIPEHPFDLDDVASHIRRRHLKGHSFSIVVVAEVIRPNIELEPSWLLNSARYHSETSR